MTQIGNHDDAYLSTPLEQKLAWFQNAPGLSAVEPASQFMAGAAALYTDSDSQVRATMRSLGADWTGDAATNAGATLQRAADWSQGAGVGNAAGGETVEGYGKSFESLRGQVHWDDPWAWGWNDTASAAASVATLDPAIFLGNLTTDYFTTSQQNRTNDAAAVAALRAHEQQTRVAVDAFPALAPPGIDPSDAITGMGSAGPHPGAGLPIAPVAPAGAGTTTGGTDVGGAGALGGVAGGLATAGAGVGRAGDPTGGGAIGGVGGATVGPIGIGNATTGPVESPGSAVAGGAGGSTSGPGLGTAASGAVGAGGLGPGVLGAGPPGGGQVGAGGLGAGGVGAGGVGAGGLGGDRAGGGGLGAGGLDGGGSASRAGLPGGLGGVAGRAPGGAGVGIPDVGPRGGTGGLAGGTASRVGLPGEQGVGLRPGDPLGRLAPPLGGGTSDGAGGGWRDVVSRGPSESGAISRGPASGAEFAARLPSGSPEAPPPSGARSAGAGMPFLGGMGAGAGARSTEHRQAYWIRTSEPFDVPLPQHGDGLLQGSDE